MSVNEYALAEMVRLQLDEARAATAQAALAREARPGVPSLQAALGRGLIRLGGWLLAAAPAARARTPAPRHS